MISFILYYYINDYFCLRKCHYSKHDKFYSAETLIYYKVTGMNHKGDKYLT
jgi:hypothetical protein